MKKKNDQSLTRYAIPDGEGFNALPIFFIYVSASSRRLSGSKAIRDRIETRVTKQSTSAWNINSASTAGFDTPCGMHSGLLNPPLSAEKI